MGTREPLRYWLLYPFDHKDRSVGASGLTLRQLLLAVTDKSSDSGFFGDLNPTFAEKRLLTVARPEGGLSDFAGRTDTRSESARQRT